MPRVNKTKLEFYVNKLYRAEIRRLKAGTKKKGGRLTPSSPQGMKVVIDCNRKCAVCSKKYDDDPGDFQIHHINGDRSKTITSNLVLFCLSHHKRIHDLAKAKVDDYKFRNKIKISEPKSELPKPKMVTVRDGLGRPIKVPIDRTKLITLLSGRKKRILKQPWEK